MTGINQRRSNRSSMLGRHLFSATVCLALATTFFAPIESANASHVDRVGLIEHTWDGVAIAGYDPVAYFLLGKAVKGSDEFQHEWLGQEWHFMSAEHRDTFIADPVKYVPQYGGYCSETHTIADINPTAWQIVAGRLYLFFSEESADRFAVDKRGQAKAEAYWQTVKDGLAL